MKLKDTIRYGSVPGRIFMTLVIMMTLLIILQAIYIELYRAYAPRRSTLPEAKLSPEEAKQKRIDETQKEILPDGTVHLVRTVGFGSRSEYDTTIEIYDTDYNSLWSGKIKDCPYAYLLWTGNYRHYPWDDHRHGLSVERFKQAQMIGGFSRPLIVPVVAQDGRIIQRWQYLPEAKLFFGIDVSGEMLGYFGANGLAKTQDQARPLGSFEYLDAWTGRDSLSPILLWQTKQKLYEIHFARQTIDLLFDGQGKEIESKNFNNWRQIYDEQKEYPSALHIKTGGRQDFVLFREPRRLIQLHRPAEWNRVQVAAYRDKVFLKIFGIEGIPNPNDRELYQKWWDENQYKALRKWVQLYQVDSQGELTSVNRFEWIQPAQKKSVDPYYLRRERVRDKVVTVSPPVFDWFFRYVRQRAFLEPGYFRFLSDVQAEFLEMIVEMRPRYLVWNWILSFLWVALALAHGWSRRTSWGRLIFWLVFTALFNLGGLLTYLALNHRPVVRCSICGKRRGLEKPACCACKAGLPMPESRDSDLVMSKWVDE